ncbi:MAG: hypothetical protein AAGA18_01860 [Verrucomicrobiota bacterium]
MGIFCHILAHNGGIQKITVCTDYLYRIDALISTRMMSWKLNEMCKSLSHKEKRVDKDTSVRDTPR